MQWWDRPDLIWQDPLRVLDEWPSGLAPGPGVYRLVALHQTIARACGSDGTGTLYIGKAGALDGRLGQLRAALRPDYLSNAHGAATLLKETTVLFNRYHLQILATTWAAMLEPRKCEEELIAAYVREFGEAPPLNRQSVAPVYD